MKMRKHQLNLKGVFPFLFGTDAIRFPRRRNDRSTGMVRVGSLIFKTPLHSARSHGQASQQRPSARPQDP